MNVTISPSNFHDHDLHKGLEIDLVHDISVLKDDWGVLHEHGTSFIYQHYDWVRIAYETIDANNKPVIIVGRNEGEIQFIIPLALVSGITSKLRWPGDHHVNIGCGLFSKRFLENREPRVMHVVFEAVRKRLNSVALLHLKNQPQTLNGFPNPMLELPHQPNPNPFYVMDLKSGFENILDMGNGKRKRKLFRRQERVAEELGGYELYIPDKVEETQSLMREFFDLKAKRFAELGIPNVFADANTQAFLLRLAALPQHNGNQLLRLFILKIGSKMRAMYGSGILGNYSQSYINAVVYDDFAEESPGEMIMHLMIQHLIEEGFESLDLGVGHERYKMSWCRNATTFVDTVYPLSYSAVPYSQYLKSETRIKGLIKSNQILWENFKKLRKLKSRV